VKLIEANSDPWHLPRGVEPCAPHWRSGNSDFCAREIPIAGRNAYQKAMKADLIAGIEHHSGRKVLTFLSDNHIEPDIAIESFVLEPHSGEAPGNLEEPMREDV
jgi:hypothetical protein